MTKTRVWIELSSIIALMGSLFKLKTVFVTSACLIPIEIVWFLPQPFPSFLGRTSMQLLLLIWAAVADRLLYSLQCQWASEKFGLEGLRKNSFIACQRVSKWWSLWWARVLCIIWWNVCWPCYEKRNLFVCTGIVDICALTDYGSLNWWLCLEKVQSCWWHMLGRVYAENAHSDCCRAVWRTITFTCQAF